MKMKKILFVLSAIFLFGCNHRQDNTAISHTNNNLQKNNIRQNEDYFWSLGFIADTEFYQSSSLYHVSNKYVHFKRHGLDCPAQSILETDIVHSWSKLNKDSCGQWVGLKHVAFLYINGKLVVIDSSMFITMPL